jgi:hypothetical protein
MLPQLHNLVRPHAKLTEKNASPDTGTRMLNVVRPGACPVATFGTSQKVEVFARHNVIILKCDCKVSGRAVL